MHVKLISSIKQAALLLFYLFYRTDLIVFDMIKKMN